jgi:hypothetical protein
MFCFKRPIGGVLAGLATAALVACLEPLATGGQSLLEWISFSLA